jgi:TonB family protein
VTEVQQPAEPSPDPEQKSPERVGPGVTPPLVVPSTRADPEYTDEARAARIQGTVVLSVTIRADGTGRVEQVVRSLDPGLDQKAIEAFQKWRFTPGMKDGKPVDVQLQVVFNFKLY